MLKYTGASIFCSTASSLMIRSEDEKPREVTVEKNALVVFESRLFVLQKPAYCLVFLSIQLTCLITQQCIDCSASQQNPSFVSSSNSTAHLEGGHGDNNSDQQPDQHA